MEHIHYISIIFPYWTMQSLCKCPNVRRHSGLLVTSVTEAKLLFGYFFHIQGQPSFVRLYQYPHFGGPNSALGNKSFYQADKVEINWNKKGELWLYTHNHKISVCMLSNQMVFCRKVKFCYFCQKSCFNVTSQNQNSSLKIENQSWIFNIGRCGRFALVQHL